MYTPTKYLGKITRRIPLEDLAVIDMPGQEMELNKWYLFTLRGMPECYWFRKYYKYVYGVHMNCMNGNPPPVDAIEFGKGYSIYDTYRIEKLPNKVAEDSLKLLGYDVGLQTRIWNLIELYLCNFFNSVC